jgi:hypothetical protein
MTASDEEEEDAALLRAVSEGSDSDEDGARKKGYGTVNGASR